MTAPVLPPGVPVHLLVRQRAEAAPEATAVSWRDGPVSARDLDRRAARIAAALAGFAGRPIAVRVPAGPDRYAALLGVLRAGAVLLWSGTGAAGERGRGILDAVRPAAVLTGSTGDDLSSWHTERTGVPLLDVGRAGRPARGLGVHRAHLGLHRPSQGRAADACRAGAVQQLVRHRVRARPGRAGGAVGLP